MFTSLFLSSPFFPYFFFSLINYLSPYSLSFYFGRSVPIHFHQNVKLNNRDLFRNFILPYCSKYWKLWHLCDLDEKDKSVYSGTAVNKKLESRIPIRICIKTMRIHHNCFLPFIFFSQIHEVMGYSCVLNTVFYLCFLCRFLHPLMTWRYWKMITTDAEFYLKTVVEKQQPRHHFSRNFHVYFL